MDPKGRDMFLQETKRDTRRGRSILSDLRMALKISSWFEPNGRGRADNIPSGDVCIGERMEKRPMRLTRIGPCIEPDQDMVNFFSSQLEVGRTARPPDVSVHHNGLPRIPPSDSVGRPANEGPRKMADGSTVASPLYQRPKSFDEPVLPVQASLRASG